MTTEASAANVERPFVGLAPFTEAEALYFFGREADRAVITSNLVAARVTVLYGPSGCGKSSLLDAGVAHEINRVRAPRQIAARGAPEFIAVTFRAWRDEPKLGLLAKARATVESVLGHPVEQTPDELPLGDALAALAGCLRGTLLIVLDQFEEYFLYHGRKVSEGTLARELVRAVCEPDLRANFLISLRDDSLAQLDTFAGHIPGLMANTLRLDRLDRARGRETIEGPVKRYNELNAKDGRTMEIGAGLVEAVLEMVETGAITLETAGHGAIEDREDEDESDHPIETAYLQLVMTRLWDAEAAAGSRLLRLETFEKLGGAERIVGTHLDTVMASFADEEREVAADLFRYLVTPTGTKIALTLGDLTEFTERSPDTTEPVLRSLGSQQVRILREVAAPNNAPEKSRYEIFHDVLATVVVDWRRRYVIKQAELKQLRAAEAKRLEEALVAEAKSREEAKAAAAKRLEYFFWSVCVVFILTAFLSVVAFRMWTIADKQKTLADKLKKFADHEATIAQSSLLAGQAVSVLDVNPDQSLVLAIAALARHRTAAAERALRLAVAVSHVRARLGGHRSSVLSVAYSPRGRELALGCDDGSAEVWDIATGELKIKFDNVKLDGRSVAKVAFGGNGKNLATVSKGGVVVIYDLRSGNAPLKRGPDAVELRAASFARDGSSVWVATSDKVIRVWEIPSGKPLMDWRVDGNQVSHLASSGDGKIAAASIAGVSGTEPQPKPTAASVEAGAGTSSSTSTSGETSTLRVWSVGAREPLLKVDEPGAVTALALSADGKWLAAGTRTGLAEAWDLATGKAAPIRTMNFNAEISGVALNATGTLLAAATNAGFVQAWDPQHRFADRGFINANTPILALALSSDGKHVLLRCEDKTARIWTVGSDLIPLRGDTGDVQDAVFSPDCRAVALASADGTARVWEVVPGVRDIAFTGPLAPWCDPVFSLNGERVIAACVDNVVRAWDSSDGRVVLELPADPGPVAAIAMSSDGKTLATAGTDRIARTWDASSRRLVRQFRGHEKPLTSVAFNPSGGRLATASYDGTARLWDLNSGLATGVLKGHGAPVTGLAFDQDGVQLATAGLDNTIRVWDTTSHREVSKRSGYSSSVASKVFSPDGRLITASMGVGRSKGAGGARIIDIGTGKTTLLDGHTGAVTGAAFSGDGKTVATCGWDRTVRLWDAATGRPGAVLYGHTDRVSSVVFSPSRSHPHLASEAYDTTGILWDTGRSLELVRLPGLTSSSSVLAFDPQGKMLATVDREFTGRLWDVTSGKVAQVLDGHKGFITQFTFSPDGLLAATASQDRTVRLWEVATAKTLKTFETPGYGALHITFSRDGRRLITAGADGTTRIWDVHGDSTKPREIAIGAAQNAVSLSSDGNRVAIGCIDGAVRLVDITETKVPGGTAEAKILGVTSWNTTTWYIPVFSPDAERMVTPGQRGSAQVWDTSAGRLIRALKGPGGDVKAARFSPDGRRLATSAVGGVVQIWDMQAGGPPLELAAKKPNAFELLVFDPTGSRLAAGSISGNTAFIWNCASGSLAAELSGHTNVLTRVAFSPDGKYLATSSQDKSVRLWRTEDGRPGPVLSDDAIVNQLSFSPDSTRLATAGQGIGGRVWDVMTGKPIDLAQKTEGIVRCFNFSPDGKRLVSAGDETSLRVWDAQTGNMLHQLRGFRPPVYHMAFSPDSQHVVAAGNDRFAALWEVESGRLLGKLEHGAAILSVAYSTDGARIVTTTANNQARIWDARTHQLLGAMGNHSVKSLAFGQDDRAIITVRDDGEVQVWEGTTGHFETVCPAQAGGINTASFSSDAARLVTTSGPLTPELSDQEPIARIWNENDTKPLELRSPPFPMNDPVNEAWFSPDGKRAITLRKDGTVKVWDANTGNVLLQLGASSFSLTLDRTDFPDAAMSPNGKFVAITSIDGRVRVYDLVTGKVLTSLTGPRGLVLSVAFSPDSTKVLATYDDGSARLFTVDALMPFDQLYERAVNRVKMLHRELTDEDLQKYLNEPVE
jgi:WD40 repeat protein